MRPFYKSAEGKYYYGDWVSFDPSDFSFFEPTVRTYPVENVTSSSATVRGYALPGTDNIRRQGFRYWRSGNQNNIMAKTPAESEIVTVEVEGQVMVATFNDLKGNTTYTYRAFVETDAGYTYGEEQTFTTESVSGIYDVEYVQPEVTVVGYYDIMGRRYDKPIHGINIVVYSDGTTKKAVYRGY